MTVGLLDEIREQVAAARGLRCPVARVMAELDKRDAGELRAAMDDRSITGSAIGKALRARGLRISDEGIRGHRNRTCSCQQKGG